MDIRQAVAVIDRRRAPRKSQKTTMQLRAVETEATPAPLDAEYSRRIAEAAYFIAERRGFAPGNELADWLQAEAELARRA